MMSIFRTIREVFYCLFQMIFMPLAHATDDRIYSADLYARSLDYAEYQRQQGRYWSVLNILRRAARRQTKMNARGQAWYDELQERKWEKGYAYMANAKYIWMVGSISYGLLAVEAVIGAHFPLLAVWWRAADAALSSTLHWLWNLLPGPDF
ncbi:hypothetical protein [Oleiharenicola lentus]|uniref:hypothetical protein n=1 Tax=Oleiharenicola lentus TaxID=2508720 RepID=UPI003F677315